MIPQTWENDKYLDKETKCYGDNDPIDIVEISNKKFACGSITPIKVLGAVCLLDQGELDWKIICINSEEAK